MNVKSGSLYIYVTSFLVVLCAVPARFAYGIVIALQMNFVMLFATVATKMFLELGLSSFCDFLTAITVIFAVVFFKLILTLCCPLIAFSLGFVLFLPVLSTLVIGSLSFEKQNFIYAMKENLYNTQVFCIVCLLFFFAREFLCYGTMTFPIQTHAGLLALKLFTKIASLKLLGFWASVPGALMIVAFILAGLNFVRSKVHIARRLEQNSGDEND